MVFRVLVIVILLLQQMQLPALVTRVLLVDKLRLLLSHSLVELLDLSCVVIVCLLRSTSQWLLTLLQDGAAPGVRLLLLLLSLLSDHALTQVRILQRSQLLDLFRHQSVVVNGQEFAVLQLLL